jgi:hypothetical protein
MDREKIIGVLYIMTFLLAAYVKFTNPHFFATISTKGIHDGSKLTYLGQVYEDRLVWSVPTKETAFAVSLWREVFVSGDQPRIDQKLFFSDSSGARSTKRIFVLKRQEGGATEQATADAFGADRLYPYQTGNVKAASPLPEVEIGLRDKASAGSYKITFQQGTGSNLAEHDTLVSLTEKDAGKIFFRHRFAANEVFNVRVWKKVNIDLPALNHQLLGQIRKKVEDKQEEFYNMKYDELFIDFEKAKAEVVKREAISKDREARIKLYAENTRFAGTYSVDIRERTRKISFASHVFEIAPKVDFAIVYPDFAATREQLAGVAYRDFVVTSQPIDGFIMVVSDRSRADTVICRITGSSGNAAVSVVRATSGIDRGPGFSVRVNQDRKIVSFDLPLKTPKTIQVIAQAGRSERTKSWQVPIRRLLFAVWPPIQPRYWHEKEKELYDGFNRRYQSQAGHSGGVDASVPLLYEGRPVSIYYDLENVDREAYNSIVLRFSNGTNITLKKGPAPIEFTMPIDVEWVELSVRLRETTLSSMFAVKAVPEAFTYDVDLSPPLEMVTEYGMSNFRVRDFFGEAIRNDLVNIEITGVPRNLVRLNKNDKDRIKLELIGIKNQKNVRAHLTLVQSPYSRSNRNVEIGRVALKN